MRINSPTCGAPSGNTSARCRRWPRRRRRTSRARRSRSTSSREHLVETRGHVERLERIIGDLALRYPEEQCEAMKGLLCDSERVISAGGNPVAREVALIAAAPRVGHYEIAAYGTTCALADELGLGQVGDILREGLNEENQAEQTTHRDRHGRIHARGTQRAGRALTAGSRRPRAPGAAACGTGPADRRSAWGRRRPCPSIRSTPAWTHGCPSRAGRRPVGADRAVFAGAPARERHRCGDDRCGFPGRRHDWAACGGLA